MSGFLAHFMKTANLTIILSIILFATNLFSQPIISKEIDYIFGLPSNTNVVGMAYSYTHTKFEGMKKDYKSRPDPVNWSLDIDDWCEVGNSSKKYKIIYRRESMDKNKKIFASWINFKFHQRNDYIAAFKEAIAIRNIAIRDRKNDFMVTVPSMTERMVLYWNRQTTSAFISVVCEESHTLITTEDGKDYVKKGIFVCNLDEINATIINLLSHTNKLFKLEKPLPPDAPEIEFPMPKF